MVNGPAWKAGVAQATCGFEPHAIRQFRAFAHRTLEMWKQEVLFGEVAELA